MKKAVGLSISAALVGVALLIDAAPIDLHIDRSTGKANIGFADFIPQDKSLQGGYIPSFQEIIAHDLEFTKMFNVIKGGPALKKRQDAGAWANLGTDIVLGGTMDRSGDDVTVSAKLYDTGAIQELIAINERRPSSQSRPLAHDVANQIVKYFTGQPGIFNSKIAFVNDATGRKELYLTDYDGRNPRKFTNDNSIVILPRISPDGKKVVFTSYVAGNPDLYVMNTDGTGRKKLSFKAGLNVSPSWSPNNQDLAVTLSVNGPPNIYLMDLSGNLRQQLTNAPGADTAPSFSPDGSQLAFTSDRSGSPHIYIMSIDGTGVRRVTTDGHCDSAAWSPDGQTIVYVKGMGKRFDIYSVEVMTGVERRLTWGDGDNENPAWSPDGKFIVFTSSRRKKIELYIMSWDGSDQRPIFTNKGQSFTPHWSY